MKMTNTSQIAEFVFAGKAIFTIKSLTSNSHWTFRFKQKDKIFFVSILNHNQDYTYLGYINSSRQYRTTSKSQYSPDHPAHTVIKYLLAYLAAGKLHPKFEFYHEGKCGRCGRPLTDPQSIARGLGPTCATKE